MKTLNNVGNRGQGQNLIFPEYDLKNAASVPNNSLNLFCDGCGSDDISESNCGNYVCKCCGLVVDGVQIYKYNSPYDDANLQNSTNCAKITTSIGNTRERKTKTSSMQLDRMAKMQSISREYESLILQIAKAELGRLLTTLHLPKLLEKDCLTIFKRVWKNLKKATKGRSPEKLASVILYMELKVKAINVPLDEILSKTNMSKEDFKEVLMEAAIYYPAYCKRDKIPLILKKIDEVRNHFSLGLEFTKSSNNILRKVYGYIKNTKDDVIAGVVCALSLISFENYAISVSKLCDFVGIKMSTVNYQVKQKLFNNLNIEGFTSLIKSSFMVKDLMLNVILAVERTNIIVQETETVSVVEDEIIISNPSTGYDYCISNVNLRDLRDILPDNKKIKGGKLKLFFYFGNREAIYDHSSNLLIGTEIISHYNPIKKKFGDFQIGKGPPPG